MVKGSFIFTSLKDSTIFSMVKDLPLIQQILMAFMLNLQSEEGAQVQDCMDSATQPPCYVKQGAKQVTQLLPVQVPHESQHCGHPRFTSNTDRISWFSYWDYKLYRYQNCWILNSQPAPLYCSSPKRLWGSTGWVLPCWHWLRLASLPLPLTQGPWYCSTTSLCFSWRRCI